MGDGDDRARVLLEVALEPGHRLGVEVVGRLVEQQQVGLLRAAAGRARRGGARRPRASRRRRRPAGSAARPSRSRACGRAPRRWRPRSRPAAAACSASSFSISSASSGSPSFALTPRSGRAGRASRPRPPRRCRARPSPGRAAAPAAGSRLGCRRPASASPRKSCVDARHDAEQRALAGAVAPSTPILAPGKNESQMPFRISRLGGTTFRRSFIVKMYWCAIGPRIIPAKWRLGLTKAPPTTYKRRNRECGRGRRSFCPSGTSRCASGASSPSTTSPSTWRPGQIVGLSAPTARARPRCSTA